MNLYEVLGISCEASDETIKKAYRKRTRECHPDRHPEKAEEFKKVQQAWDVLGDKKKRAHYDATGQIEESKEPRITELLDLALSNVIAKCMELKQPLRIIDMVTAIDAHLSDRINLGLKDKEMTATLIKEIKTTVGRYKKKKKDKVEESEKTVEQNIFEDLTRNRISMLEAQLESIQIGIDELKEVQKFLKDFTFLKDVPKTSSDFDERYRFFKEMLNHGTAIAIGEK